MYAVRCSGQVRGFKVEGEHFDYHRWTLKNEINEAIAAEPMLTVLQIDQEDDVRLAPFPVVDTSGVERETVVNVGALQDELAARDRRIAALEHQIEEALVLRDQYESRVRELEARLTGLSQEFEEVKTSVDTFPEGTPTPIAQGDSSEPLDAGAAAADATTQASAPVQDPGAAEPSSEPVDHTGTDGQSDTTQQG
jgi:hypothetical protein